eukprot:6181045-Prymnesium_polylepis.1
MSVAMPPQQTVLEAPSGAVLSQQSSAPPTPRKTHFNLQPQASWYDSDQPASKVAVSDSAAAAANDLARLAAKVTVTAIDAALTALEREVAAAAPKPTKRQAAARWFYVDKRRAKQGPFPLEEMVALMQA